MWSKMGTVPPGTSGSYTPVQNVAFVAREFWGDTDDELVKSELEQEFGGDGFYIARAPSALGLAMTDDGCEPLVEETDEEYWDRSEDDSCPEGCRCDECTGRDDYYDDGYDEEDAEKSCDGHIPTDWDEIVKETLELQAFFQRGKQKAAEARKALDEAHESSAPEGYDEPELAESEMVEKAVLIRRHYSSPGYNHKGRLRWKIDRKTFEIVRTYFSQGRRCYGGQDNRRVRRNDDTGKVIGHNHRRREYDHDAGKRLRPVAVLLDYGDGTCHRFRIS